MLKSTSRSAPFRSEQQATAMLAFGVAALSCLANPGVLIPLVSGTLTVPATLMVSEFLDKKLDKQYADLMQSATSDQKIPMSDVGAFVKKSERTLILKAFARIAMAAAIGGTVHFSLNALSDASEQRQDNPRIRSFTEQGVTLPNQTEIAVAKLVGPSYA